MTDEQRKIEPDVEAALAELDAAAAAIRRARDRLAPVSRDGASESVCGFMPPFD